MPLRFVFTPEEAQPIARIAARWLARTRGATIIAERTIWADAPYRTTLFSTRPQPHVLIEAQGTFNYQSVADLAEWLMANRQNAELYVAIDSEVAISGAALEKMKRDGVGLLLITPPDQVILSHGALNPALTVTPNPSLSYGDRRTEVNAAIRKYNTVNRKDGLRDMCEIVEDETTKLAIAAARKGLLTLTEAVVRGQNWSSQINTLASSNVCAPNGAPLLDENQKNDFQSFRGARNLVDHPAPTRAQEARRTRQFPERMAQGPRLVAELIAMRRRVARRR